jgi:hypothetical protein
MTADRNLLGGIVACSWNSTLQLYTKLRPKENLDRLGFWKWFGNIPNKSPKIGGLISPNYPTRVIHLEAFDRFASGGCPQVDASCLN